MSLTKILNKAPEAFGILPGWRVLDIGSGQTPFPLATELADKFPDNDMHRSNQPLCRDSRPFHVWDLENIDTPDKSFDFAYISHVLEHVVDPNKACNELIRIAKHGYIETPSWLGEQLFGDTFECHKWQVEAINGKLYFRRNTIEVKDPAFSKIQWHLLYAYRERKSLVTADKAWSLGRDVDTFLRERPELFFTRVLWEDSFEWIIL